jgi:prolyl oligopeptidase
MIGRRSQPTCFRSSGTQRAAVIVAALCACSTPKAPPAASAVVVSRVAVTSVQPASPAPDAPPATERHAVTDTYGGTAPALRGGASFHAVSVVDDYRWLEEDGSDAERAWTAAQNAYTRRVLDQVPGRDAIAARVSQVLQAPLISYPDVKVAGGRWFVLQGQPPKQQGFLVMMPAGGDPRAAKPVLDPNLIDPSGKTTIDFYVPAPDGKKVAVSLSRAGTESGDVQVVDVDSGASSDPIARVNGGTAGGDLAWTRDGKGFYYTRYPARGERPVEDLDFYQQVYFHRLGSDPHSDTYELGRELPRIAEIRLDVDARSERVLASVQKGDGGQFAHYLRTKDGRWRQLTQFEDGVVHVAFGPSDDLFAVSRHASARGVVLRVNGKTLDFRHPRVLHAPDHGAIITDFSGKRSLLFGKDRWYATFQVGGPSVIRAFDYAGNSLVWNDPLEVASMGELTRDGEHGVLFRAGSFLEPNAWYRYEEAPPRSAGAVPPTTAPPDKRSAKLEKTALANAAPIDMHAYRVVREFATSKDGTQVPFNVLMPPNAQLDRSNLCVVTGYGGYGLSLEPHYNAKTALWLERGAIFVVANLRGGGEFGEDWHHAGNLTHKQNVFDDFAAVLHQLVERGYTQPARLGIIGGSNGGLLMGATLVQHPELMHAVVSFVGFYDSLRVELSPNGAFNVTEFGSVADPTQFAALYAYSPYHHVTDGTAYPRVLFVTGENDPRVAPMQSRKMAARLQASGAGGPFLLRTSQAAGHGGGNDLAETVAQTTDAMTFMLDALSGTAPGS